MKTDAYLTELALITRLHVSEKQAAQLVSAVADDLVSTQADPVETFGPPTVYARSLTAADQPSRLPVRAITIGLVGAVIGAVGMASFVLASGGSPVEVRGLPTPVAVGLLICGLSPALGGPVRDMFRFGTSRIPLFVYVGAVVAAMVGGALVLSFIDGDATFDVPGGRATGVALVVATVVLMRWLYRPLPFPEGSSVTSTWWGKVKLVTG